MERAYYVMSSWRSASDNVHNLVFDFYFLRLLYVVEWAFAKGRNSSNCISKCQRAHLFKNPSKLKETSFSGQKDLELDSIDRLTHLAAFKNYHVLTCNLISSAILEWALAKGRNSSSVHPSPSSSGLHSGDGKWKFYYHQERPFEIFRIFGALVGLVSHVYDVPQKGYDLSDLCAFVDSPHVDHI